MKPVEEIARETVGEWLDRSTFNPKFGEEADALCIAIIAAIKARDQEHATALRAEREKHACPIGLDDTPTVCSAGTCVRCLNDRIVGLMGRAEKAEAERDEVLWDARYQIDAQVKSREAAETALATARNRALEEAAECVKDCRQWEPECPHAARILSLRIPEAST